MKSMLINRYNYCKVVICISVICLSLSTLSLSFSLSLSLLSPPLSLPSPLSLTSPSSTLLHSISPISLLLFSYSIGDIVMFHPVGKPPTNFQLNLLHLTKPFPYVFLHKDCYPTFSFRFGRM